MPALAAKKRPAISPTDLAAEISRMQDEIEAFIQRHVDALKASRDGASQPIESLRREIIRKLCPCQAALRLCEQN
jgi:hypothetical protein